MPSRSRVVTAAAAARPLNGASCCPNVIISANQFATSGYHTGALINNGTNVVNSANLGA